MRKKEGLIDILVKNERILRAEYQRGYAEGGKDMNEKWLFTRKEIIAEFLEDLRSLETWHEIPWDCYHQIDDLKEKWEDKLK